MKRLIIILLIIVSWLIPQPVRAATDTLAVASEGGCSYLPWVYSTGTYIGGAADYTVLNDSNDATYLESSDGVYGRYSVRHCYNMVDFVSDYASITSVSVYYKVGGDYPWSSTYIVIGATEYYSTQNNGYGWVTKTWNTNPSTGAAWTAAGINAAKFGVALEVYNNYGAYTSIGADCIEYSIIVTYAPPTVPIMSTSAVTSNTNNSATLNGTITSNGGSAITDYGFVWDTVSRADPGNTAPTASAYAAKWENGATVAVGAISHATGATLTENTVYYYRSAAENAIGWSYGSELSFKTVGDPAITTTEATNIATTTATINSLIADANGQLCDVRFGYGTTSQATIAAYDVQTAWVENTYTTGQTALVNITGLTANDQYFFRAEIRNDAGTVLGDELYFTTFSGINEPSSVTAIPTSNTLSITWTKGTGASETLVRYSLGSYPLTTIDGTYAYLGTGNSVLITGLTSGTTVYVSLWGKTGAIYSVAKKTVLSTLTAYSTVTTTPVAPTEPDSLYQSPDDSIVSQIPIIGALVQINSDAFGMSTDMIWYLVYIAAVILICIVLFRTSGSNWITISGVVLSLGIGVVLKVGALMAVGLITIIIVSLTTTHERR